MCIMITVIVKEYSYKKSGWPFQGQSMHIMIVHYHCWNTQSRIHTWYFQKETGRQQSRLGWYPPLWRFNFAKYPGCQRVNWKEVRFILNVFRYTTHALKKLSWISVSNALFTVFSFVLYVNVEINVFIDWRLICWLKFNTLDFILRSYRSHIISALHANDMSHLRFAICMLTK